MATYHLSIKSGPKGTASEHSRYISRTGKYAKRDDLVATSFGNLPDWASGPNELWLAADKYERANGAAYREYEVALPSELSPKQQLDLLHSFIDCAVAGKPYQYAIHEPIAALGGVPQPHAHVMFCDRTYDGIERTPEQHFRRHNPARPELGGCKKYGSGMHPCELREAVVELRTTWADLTNRALMDGGHAARVDHRSHTARGLPNPPGRHLGQARIRKAKTSETDPDTTSAG